MMHRNYGEEHFFIDFFYILSKILKFFVYEQGTSVP